MTGLARAVIEYAMPYAKDRVAFDQAIAQKQAIAFMLADMHIETDVDALARLEGREPARAAAPTRRAPSLFARAYAAEQSMKIADNGVQVLGGHGFIREHPVEMWYRNARTLGVLEGARSLTSDASGMQEEDPTMIDFSSPRRTSRSSTTCAAKRSSCRKYARYYDENEHELPPGRAARGEGLPERRAAHSPSARPRTTPACP